MQNQLRQIYLEKIWQAYPSAGPGTYGRLAFKNEQAVLLGYGPLILAELSLPEGGDFTPDQVLLEGDLIAIQEKTITLLAPCLTNSSFDFNLQYYREWLLFKQQTRSFFLQKNFEEVETPFLVSCPGTEPFLDPMMVELMIGREKYQRYLPTSPELHLKKLLARGFKQIFEIKSCFRNAELSPYHQPEFCMLEWYRAYQSLDDIKQDIQDLVAHFSEGKSTQFTTLSMAQLFQQFLGFRLTPETNLVELQQLATQLQLRFDADFDFDDLFGLIFVDQIEPKLKKWDCLFLTNYPPSQAALARLTTDGWGDRFEFYFKGIEIANAFNELNDPQIQRLRSQADNHTKQRIGKPVVNLDEDFYQHLEVGMPPSAGVALGLERLFLVLKGLSDLSKIRPFPIIKD